MQVQNVTASATIGSRGHESARRQRKLHLPLALANKPARGFDRPQSLSGHELRRIVAGMLG